MSYLLSDRSVSNRYRSSGGDSELLAVGADGGHRVRVLRPADILPLLLAQHQAPRGCE